MNEFLANRRTVIGAGIVLGAGTALAAPAGAAAQDSGGRWQPTFESIDAWLDKPGTRHRMVFDTVNASAGMDALGFANTFYYENQAAYGVAPDQIGVVVVFRHMSTPFGYGNSAWAKYGAKFAKQLKLDPAVAKTAAKRNPVLVANPNSAVVPAGLEWWKDDNLTALRAKGAQFAVCGLATKAIAMQLAKGGGSAAAIEAELKASLIPGAVIVPAGIVAVNRAQEHGYTFAYIP